MSRNMGKPTICLGENKGADQLRSNAVTAKLISAFVFATRIVQFLFYLRMFAANEKVFKLFSNHSFLIPKYNTRHLKTK